jgi:hypothetical protein
MSGGKWGEVVLAPIPYKSSGIFEYFSGGLALFGDIESPFNQFVTHSGL